MRSLLLAALAALSMLSGVSEVRARPFTVDDLVHQESFGAASIDPQGRWLVFEQRGPYNRAARFDRYTSTSRALSQLRVVDLHRLGPAKPLLAKDPGPGVLLGPFSPSGDRLAVYKMGARTWTLGVVTLATGAVRWLPLTPQAAGAGRTLDWLTDRELLAIVRPDKQPPWSARVGWVMADRLPAYWAAAATGRSAHTVLGSGAYAAVRARSAPNELIRLDARSGVLKVLAIGAFTDLEVSPRRTRVALFESGEDLQSHGSAPVRGAAGLETEATHLSLVDLTTGATTRPCATCDLLPQLLTWAPSGRSLLVYARGDDGLWTDGRLLRIDAARGTAEIVGRDLQADLDLNPVIVRAGWMGEDPLIFARPPASRPDWYRLSAAGPVSLSQGLTRPPRAPLASDGLGLTVMADGGLWRLDPSGRSERPVQPASASLQQGPRPGGGARLSAAPPIHGWMILGAAPDRVLAPVDAEGLSALRIPLPRQGEIVAASTLAAAAVVHDIDPRGVETLALATPTGGLQIVATVNRSLADTDPPDVHPIQHLGPAGERLTSWLYLPSAGQTTRPAPLVVRPYLGDVYPVAPRDRYMELGFFQNIRTLTGHGYAVLVPSLPNVGDGTDPAIHLADRILAIVQAAATDPAVGPRVDPDRLALIGWSFGGYTVMATITQTSRFRAAVEMDGISDLVTYWAHLGTVHTLTPEEGYESNWATGGVEATQPTLHVPPWGDPERYRRNSPLMAADRIETPLMLVHGGQDPIPAAQSEAMYSALFRQGKDAELVIYWGANHTVTSPGDVRDLYARTFSFLDAHVTPGSGPGAKSANREPGPANSAPMPPPPRP